MSCVKQILVDLIQEVQKCGGMKLKCLVVAVTDIFVLIYCFHLLKTKIFLIKSKSFQSLHWELHNLNIQGPER